MNPELKPDTNISRISRRKFITGLILLGLGAASLMAERSGITLAKTPPKRYPVIGDYLPKILPEKNIFSAGGGGMELPTGMPEQEKDNRSWYKVENILKPPGSYRSAICWSEKLNGFLLHGGWSYNTNHNETWIFKDNQWSKLEKGSTPSLHGHKMTDTPLGVVLFGGVVKQPDGIYETSDQFFLFNQEKNTWEKLAYRRRPDRSVPQLQGVGMVYNPKTESIWIMGGGSGNPVQVSDVTYELLLPGVWETNNWYFRGRGYLGNFNYPQVFEPLAYCIPGNPATYLYGGLGPDLQGISAFTKGYKITNIETNIKIEQSTLPGVDYGGALRGGYDVIKHELILHSGQSHNFYQSPYWQTIEIKTDNPVWYKIKSPLDPPVYDKPAVAINPAGVMLRFGGSYYDEKDQPRFSDETWLLKPIFRTYLPLATQGK